MQIPLLGGVDAPQALAEGAGPLNDNVSLKQKLLCNFCHPGEGRDRVYKICPGTALVFGVIRFANNKV